MPTIGDIAAVLEAWAPPAFAESYDNVGLHIGDSTRTVSRGLVALDLTPSIVDAAIRGRTSLIVTHHPLLFSPLRSITADTLIGSMVLRLITHDIALYSAHTNLDAAKGGVSFALATLLGVNEPQFLAPREDGASGMGAIGNLQKAVPLSVFLDVVSQKLDSPTLRYVGSNDHRVHSVAVCGGAGSGLISTALHQGADAMVTGDVSYHRFFDVLQPDGSCMMAVIDAGHYETERHAEALLCTRLQHHFPQIQWERSAVMTSPVRHHVNRQNIS